MNRILITTSSFDLDNNEPIACLRQAGCEIVLNPHGRRLSAAEASALLADGYIGMIAGVEPLTRAVIEAAPSLKIISRCGIGLDSVDLEAAAARGITVCNTPGAPVSAVAELTIGLMLNLLRRVSQADRTLRNGEWKQLMGNLLAYQTVGIVGFGRIGRRVAELAHAFGSKILVHDAAPANIPAYCQAVGFEDLLAQSDVVTLHLPFLSELHHFFGRPQFERMKRGAFFLNVARGGLVDEAALLDTLQADYLAGAALDTFEQEPYNGPLRALPQVLLTAHMGSYAKESRIQMEHEAAHNLLLGLQTLNVIPAAVAAAY
jgi:D-3-phosphoglycerate dehydrogenase